MPEGSSHSTHRAFFIASVGANLALALVLQKGWLNSLPDGLIAVICLIPILSFLWWLWIHPSVKKRRHLLYTRPKMSLAIMMIVFGLVGMGVGSFLWWAIHRQEAKAAAESKPQTRVEPLASASERPVEVATPTPLTSAPSSSPVSSVTSNPPLAPSPATETEHIDEQFDSSEIVFASIFNLPDKTIEFYPPDYGKPVVIRYHLHYRAGTSQSMSALVIHIPAGINGDKAVVSCFLFAIDQFDQLVANILEDVNADKTRALALRGQKIEPKSIVFYHDSPIPAQDLGTVVARANTKGLFVRERHGRIQRY